MTEIYWQKGRVDAIWKIEIWSEELVHGYQTVPTNLGLFLEGVYCRQNSLHVYPRLNGCVAHDHEASTMFFQAILFWADLPVLTLVSTQKRRKSKTNFICFAIWSETIFRELKKPRRRRGGQRRLKIKLIFYLRISRYPEVIYLVCLCQSCHEVESRTHR